MTRKKEVILKRIIEFYIDSPEFNGIPHWQLHAEVGGNIQDVNTLLEELLFERRIVLHYTGNPYVKQFEEASHEEQLQALQNWRYNKIGVYPAKSCLADVIDDEYNNQPFARMAFMGKPQLTPVFFEMEVLEHYFQDSNYIVNNSDFWGSLSRKGIQQQDNNLPILPTFGLGYKENGERVLAVYLQYLFKMSAKHQQHWQAYLVQENCRVAYEYYQELILEEKAEYRSIYEAFLTELYHINQMSMIILGKTLFLNDFKDSRPADFRTIFHPTREIYYKFLKVLQDVMSNNLNPDFLFNYSTDINNDFSIAEQNILMFKKMLKERVRISHQEDFNVIFEPFQKIHNLELVCVPENIRSEYSKKIFGLQNQWMVESYNSVKMLRLLFANHPAVKEYEVPDWLLLGKVTIY